MGIVAFSSSTHLLESESEDSKHQFAFFLKYLRKMQLCRDQSYLFDLNWLLNYGILKIKTKSCWASFERNAGQLKQFPVYNRY